MAVDWGRVPANVRDDISDYLRDNPGSTGLLEMSPMEAFTYYCQWNGLMGWSHSLVDAAIGLGAVLPSPDASKGR